MGALGDGVSGLAIKLALVDKHHSSDSIECTKQDPNAYETDPSGLGRQYPLSAYIGELPSLLGVSDGGLARMVGEMELLAP